MILKTECIKEVSNDILSAVDTSEVGTLTDTLELSTEDGQLIASVSNREYVVEVKLADNVTEDFHIAVNAKLFLKLVSQNTTEDIELKVADKSLVLKGNGTYRIPLVYDESGEVATIDKIEINNVVCEMPVESEILNGILRYNSRQIADVSRIRSPLQNLYYVDNMGAITYTDGATVNNFSLDKPISLLLTGKIVKLFKLFKSGCVNLVVGRDADEADNVYTKVQLHSDTVTLTYITPSDDSLVKAFPVDAIRGRANDRYPYAVNLNRVEFLQSLNRMKFFTTSYGGRFAIQPVANFAFGNEEVTLSDTFTDGVNKNTETVKYINTTNMLEEPYVCTLNMNDLIDALSTCVDPYVTVAFGDSPAIIIKRGTVVDVIAKCEL